MYFTEKLLLLSMKWEKSRRPGVRFLGKVVGLLPLWYAQHMEKRLFQGKRKPAKRHGRLSGIHRRKRDQKKKM